MSPGGCSSAPVFRSFAAIALIQPVVQVTLTVWQVSCLTRTETVLDKQCSKSPASSITGNGKHQDIRTKPRKVNPDGLTGTRFGGCWNSIRRMLQSVIKNFPYRSQAAQEAMLSKSSFFHCFRQSIGQNVSVTGFKFDGERFSKGAHRTLAQS